MKWLDATDHMDALAALNATSSGIQVSTAMSASGRSLVAADALSDLGYLAHFAQWYRLLPATDEQPAPPPPVEVEE